MSIKRTTVEKPVVLQDNIINGYALAGIAIDYFDLFLCTSGSSKLLLNFEPVDITPDTVMVLFPADVMKVEAVSDDFGLKHLLCAEDVWQEVVQGAEIQVINHLRRHFYFKDAKVAEITRQLFRLTEMLFTYYTPEAARAIAVSQIKSLVSAYGSFLALNHVDMQGPSSRTDELYKQFNYYLSRYFRESRDVRYYADLMNITPKYLSNIIQAKTGKTAKSMIDEYSIMQVKLALLSSDKPVKELAWDYNFSSLAFFCDYFKRHTGMTPQHFREYDEMVQFMRDIEFVK